jgi:2-alkenal reductase
MNRRFTPWIAVLGCGALLLLVALPLGLLFWAFNGGLSAALPDLGQNDPAPEVQVEPPQRQATASRPNAIPGTGQEIGGLAETNIQPPGDLPELYNQVVPGTVSIIVGVTQGGQAGAGAGSGFILTDEGYIVTNDHVVEGGDTYIVRFFNNVDVQAELVGADPDSDLAIIKVEELPEGTYPLPLGAMEDIRVGESVVAIGNPFGLGTSMSYGIVSALGRTIPALSQFNIPQAIQTDAAINPGNSGGPLINMNGEVIGVNAQIRTSGETGVNSGVGFAIPVDIVKLVYPSLIQNGSYSWAYLGVTSPADVPGFLQPEEMQNAPDGAFIAEVTPGGPAATAGLQPGDVVVGVDGEEVRSFEELLTIVAFHQPGEQVTLSVARGGEQLELPLTLGERPSGGVQ